MTASLAFARLSDVTASRVMLTARYFEERATYAWERAFWAALTDTADLAAQRYVTGHPRVLTFRLPSFGDLAPDDVGNHAAVVLAALARLRQTPGRAGDLYGALAAEVANERDATLRRLREPNPFQLLTVGGAIVNREGPM